jgi:hypothetical protein
LWRVTTDCIGLYKAAITCTDAPSDNLCCSRADKLVWNNAWSLYEKNGADALVTVNASERSAFLSSGWLERCHPIAAPTAFCVDTSGAISDGSDGPFMLYNTPAALPPPSGTLLSMPIPLFRCKSTGGGFHYLSTNADCEGFGSAETELGWVADRPGGEALRALRRCHGAAPDSWTHSLDVLCDHPDLSAPLGWVR